MAEGGYRQINKSLNACAFGDYLSTQQATLPTLDNVAQMSPRVIRILGQNPGQFTLQGTNTYIVGTGPTRAIIDSGQGPPEWADLVASTLESYSINLSHVLLTHWHGDHTGGVPDLIRRFPHLSDSIYKNAPDAGQKPITDGQLFKIEGATIRALHSPGHSHDHICFILEEDSAMFTGDNILGHGTSAVEELSEYMDTLRKMKSQECAIGYPAHGAVISNLKAKLAGELAQKVRRENKILTTLQNETENTEKSQMDVPSMTVKEIVTEMYGKDLGTQVKEAVLEPFTDEVLEKLAEDGKVAFKLDNDRKRWFSVDSLGGVSQ